MELFLLEQNAKFFSVLKNQRKFLEFWNRFLVFLRKMKIPVYKNIFDALTFRSYYPVLKEVLEYKRGRVYFEWGPGLNTQMALKYMKEVYSVEHDHKWQAEYSKKFPVIFSPISMESCLNYPNEIKKINKKIDVAYVDGRCRVGCIKSCSEAGVPIVVMHDSLNPFTFKPANDAAPPRGGDLIYFYKAFAYYKYFLEVGDFRTVILLQNLNDFEFLKKHLSAYYFRSGLSQNYMDVYEKQN